MRTPKLLTLFLLTAAAPAAATPLEAADAPTVGVELAQADAAMVAEPATDAEVLADADDEGAEEETGLPVSLSVSTGFNLPAGTVAFRDPLTVGNAFSQSFGFGVSYPFLDTHSVSANWGFSYTYTDSGTIVDGCDYTEESCHRRRFFPNDVSIGYANHSIYKEKVTGINLSGSAGFILPTSLGQRTQNTISRFSAGLALSRQFGDFSISYGLNALKYWHQYTSTVYDGLPPAEVARRVREGGAEAISSTAFADGGVLTSFGLSHALSLGYALPANLSLGLTMGLSTSWRYKPFDADEFAPAGIDLQDRGHSTAMSSGLSLSYSFLEHFSTSLSFSTGGSFYRSDNSGVRWPFWDTQSGNFQYSNIGWSLSARY